MPTPQTPDEWHKEYLEKLEAQTTKWVADLKEHGDKYVTAITQLNTVSGEMLGREKKVGVRKYLVHSFLIVLVVIGLVVISKFTRWCKFSYTPPITVSTETCPN